MKIDPYLTPLQASFQRHADPQNAPAMSKYMRSQFAFLGIKAPLRKEITRAFFREHGLPPPAKAGPLVMDLWQLPEREFQYAGVSLMRRLSEKLAAGALLTVERMITEKSWWDTVDEIAARVVGRLFARLPDVQAEALPAWRESDNFWLRRSALLFQLHYKSDTDMPLLFEIIHENLDSTEFFIQKAIGWALRQASKTYPQDVLDFTAVAPLAPLSRREALKWLAGRKRGAQGDD
jgi:3-methyladenine DNA glycosylase AlkD